MRFWRFRWEKAKILLSNRETGTCGDLVTSVLADASFWVARRAPNRGICAQRAQLYLSENKCLTNKPPRRTPGTRTNSETRTGTVGAHGRRRRRRRSRQWVMTRLKSCQLGHNLRGFGISRALQLFGPFMSHIFTGNGERKLSSPQCAELPRISPGEGLRLHSPLCRFQSGNYLRFYLLAKGRAFDIQFYLLQVFFLFNWLSILFAYFFHFSSFGIRILLLIYYLQYSHSCSCLDNWKKLYRYWFISNTLSSSQTLYSVFSVWRDVLTALPQGMQFQ